ncbi:hypothetical protein E1B28_006294 [Marasmius oreades]|uniref:Protein kinase domain-containing protein n=1 Tax=Marasmius oreades TaxID=181124 RepID=A0A9P7S6W3_9AGAR|nr:uncharacterized protein E1B28_006294 [Marasmius oreades]KAG7095556.1 hypothetical protein E1B28_006294 [Marasmius oreades]
MGSQHSKTLQSQNPNQDVSTNTNQGAIHKGERLLNRMSMKFKDLNQRPTSTTSLRKKFETEEDTKSSAVSSTDRTSGQRHEEVEKRPAPDTVTGQGQEASKTSEAISNTDLQPTLEESITTIRYPAISVASAVKESQSSHSTTTTNMPTNTTVPCQYRTGKTLGSGTYAIVKEAIHVKTGKYYACKVINKKLMEGREYMVRNEIAVLKRISSGNRNVVTLHDYFETAHNLYLCFDLCTGGELFDRICAKGNYYEADAADLVRTIMRAVKYIHAAGIVHRDLKPENLLFRTIAEDADIMIADFGLSRIMEEEKLSMLTEICGTPGYMAPEIFKKTGHGKPVDVWAMGVITYFLLAGYTPFDKDSQQAEMEAIIAGDYKFEPQEYWANVSDTARDFVRECLTIDPTSRPTAEEALKHKWLADSEPHYVPSSNGEPTDLLPHVKKAFNARQLWRKAAFGIRALNRMSALAGVGPDAQKLKELKGELSRFKEESEKEVMENTSIVHHHHISEGDQGRQTAKETLKSRDDLSVEGGNEPRTGQTPELDHLENKMARTRLEDEDNEK